VRCRQGGFGGGDQGPGEPTGAGGDADNILCNEGRGGPAFADERTITVPEHKVWFGCALGAWNGADVSAAAEYVRLGVQADRDGHILQRTKHYTQKQSAGS
jgi:hypothetical protein